MKNKLIIFLSALLMSGFISCNKSGKPGNSKSSAYSTDMDEADENVEVKKEEHSADEKDGESEKKFNTRYVEVKFPPGSAQITLDGSINGFGDKISYEFEASKGQTLNASVKPDDAKGNVRINQIFFPDGKADGPFGEKMTYDLTESGNWKLIIGEDLMAGEPWKGTYLLTIELK